MLRTYTEVAASLAGQLAACGLTATTPSLRRWGEDDPWRYGSEIEMNMLRRGEIEDALDVLLYLKGKRQVETPDDLRAWLTREIEGCCDQAN